MKYSKLPSPLSPDEQLVEIVVVDHQLIKYLHIGSYKEFADDTWPDSSTIK